MTATLSNQSLPQDYRSIPKIRLGLPAAVVGRVANSLGLPEAELIRTLGLSTRTISRKKTARRRLSQQESERIARVVRLRDLATEVLGAESEANTWLKQPLPIFDGSTPLSMLDTDLGTAEVERALQAIKWGIYL